MCDEKKTLIGVLASHDEAKANRNLQEVFNYIYIDVMKGKECNDPLKDYHFVFTGGTYDRLMRGANFPSDEPVQKLETPIANWLREKSTRLPTAPEGGVIFLSCFITQRQCSIVWPFFGPNGNHWTRQENLAFMRLCDQWHVKRLMNPVSVKAWLSHEANNDAVRNPQELKIVNKIKTLELNLRSLDRDNDTITINYPQRLNNRISGSGWTGDEFKNMTIALIAHDDMKPRMVDFAKDHETDLIKFEKILATGTTGKEVAETSYRIKNKMIRYHSGPQGGDIEIATAILNNRCNVVIFFTDPLMAHPHIEDIRVVSQACMIKDNVVMISNEMHAREFMSRVVRGNEELTL